MPDDNTTTTLLRLPAVLAATGLSRSQVYRLMATTGDQQFPKPVRLGGTASVAWRSHEVAAWIDRQA